MKGKYNDWLTGIWMSDAALNERVVEICQQFLQQETYYINIQSSFLITLLKYSLLGH